MISPLKPPEGGRRGTQVGEGPLDNMGNPLWSLGSITDFPPLHIDNSYQEDMRGEEDIIINESVSSEDTTNSETSFQEALTREKAKERKEGKIILTRLTKKDNHITPYKKVTVDDSGWWDITNVNVTQENKKTNENVVNLENKNVDYYLSLNKPTNVFKNTNRKILDELEPEYNPSMNYKK